MNLSEKEIKRFWSKIEKTDECWNWQRGLTADGYGTLGIGNGKTIKASRLALILTKPNPDNKPYALHTCKQNRKCCNPDHLYWGDQIDNMKDREKDGTNGQRFGEKNSFAKLTENQVIEIREKYETKQYSYDKLAEEYKIGRSSIGRIIRNEYWTNI